MRKTIASALIFSGAVACFTLVGADRAYGKSVSNNDPACAKFVQEFYNWYNARTKTGKPGRAWDSALKEKPAAFNKELTMLLKEDASAQDKVTGEIVGLDFDPFLNTNSGDADSYVVGDVHPKSGVINVDVYSITAGKKGKKPVVVPALEKTEGGRWWFVNFHYGPTEIPENENLVSILKVLRKDRQKPAK